MDPIPIKFLPKAAKKRVVVYTQVEGNTDTVASADKKIKNPNTVGLYISFKPKAF